MQDNKALSMEVGKMVTQTVYEKHMSMVEALSLSVSLMAMGV